MIVAKKSKKKVEGKQEQHFDSEKSTFYVYEVYHK